jgi:hypothetical protein
MQTISRYPLIRIILSIVSIGLIAAAIGMELLPEEEAKVFVIPTLVAALFAGVGLLSISKVR